MKLSLNWLQDFLDKPIKQDIVDQLTTKTGEVDDVIHLAEQMDGVVVVEVLELEAHPNADRLRVAKVDDGKKKYTVVCGAPNVAVGQKVGLATIGTALPGGKIEKVKIRGVESHGMIVSEEEIGLGEDAAGIMVLPEDTKLGQPLAKALNLEDTVLDIENKSLTHRPDLYSHIGFAREIAAIYGTRMKEPNVPAIKPGSGALTVEVKAPKFCDHYMAVQIDDITVEESPEWLQTRLRAIGQQPINNIVDITNYVMFELGQPLHAFDTGVIGDKIIVRPAKLDEKMTLLDGNTVKLSPQDHVIANTKEAVAVAGVIGGKKSGVEAVTTSIVLESAHFEPLSVRKTAASLGVRTESHTRFEKGLPAGMAEFGLKRAVELVLEIAGGKVASKVADVGKKSTPAKAIPFTLADAERIIGTSIPNGDKHLKNLGFEVTKTSVKAPWWRPDVTIMEDVVEEVGRMFGLENIPEHVLTGSMEPQDLERTLKWEDELVTAMKGLGWTETYLYSFYHEGLGKQAGFTQKPKRLTNPLSEDLAVLRVSLLPNLLVAAEKNQHNFSDVRLYERGHVFEGANETHHLAGVVLGDPQKQLFYVKGSMEALCDTLNVRYQWKHGDAPALFSNALNLVVDGKVIGSIGTVTEKVTEAFGLDTPATAFEMSWEALAQAASTVQTFRLIPEFPAVKMDMAVIVDEKTTWEGIEKAVHKADGHITDIDVFDVYRGKQIPKGKKSIAFSFDIQDPKKTLTKEEAGKVVVKVEKALKSHGGEVRKS